MELVQTEQTEQSEQAIDFQLVEQYEKDLTKAATAMLSGETGYKAQVYKLLGSEHHLDEGMLALCRMFVTVEQSYDKDQNKEKNQTLSKLRKAIAKFCSDTDTEKLTVKSVNKDNLTGVIMHTERDDGTVMALLPAQAKKEKADSEGLGDEVTTDEAYQVALDAEFQTAINAFRKDTCLNNKLILDGIMEQMIAERVLAA